MLVLVHDAPKSGASPHLQVNGVSASGDRFGHGVQWFAAASAQPTLDFYGVGCHTCPAKTACTTARYRGLTLHPREQQETLVRRRAEQDSAEWKTRYNIRAGIEATISQAVRHCDARHTRYRGLPKVRLEQVLIATAIDLCRLDAWWTGTPLGPTRTTHYAHLELALTAQQHR
ncbi:transposase [Catenulispora acidiphila]|uniref:transposase n=1 Tax=Catenulispora acidiphila TaxID=304895 RepID=UPI00019E404E|nr:transposase [Catenulispora acidiphila]